MFLEEQLELPLENEIMAVEAADMAYDISAILVEAAMAGRVQNLDSDSINKVTRQLCGAFSEALKKVSPENIKSFKYYLSKIE